MTRRRLLATLGVASAAAAQRVRPKVWKPKLGFLTQFVEANLDFARQEGFTSVQFQAAPGLDTDQDIERAKAALARNGLYLSSVISTVNHTDPDPAVRKRVNAGFARAIETAARLGAPYVGSASGSMPGRRLDDQVSEIVRVYTEQYFPLCEKHKIRILWEPWPGGPNIATGPVGYEALFRAFGDSPYVGLLYDPSHLVWQMMDPVQCARDYADKIFDVHLKDCEILWPVVRRAGIQPVNGARWWRFRLPGYGDIDWRGFFNVLAAGGYQGAMNIEHEDELYGAPPGADGAFSEDMKSGLRVCHAFLRQFVPA